MEIFGGKVAFEAEEDYNIIVEKLKNDNMFAFLILEKAIEYGVSVGLFNLQENAILYNCLESIKKNEG